MSAKGHARLVGTREPVLIDWLGKAGAFPRYGVFSVFTLDDAPHHLSTRSEYGLEFGGCTDDDHDADECPFLTGEVEV